MDILQKARAYDEALERARKELNVCGSQDCDAARQIFRFFPELKGSEDDEIRKQIVELVMQPTWKTEAEFHRRKELVTWLKKQEDINSKEYVFRPHAGCHINTAAIQAVEQQKLGKKIVFAFNGAYIPVEGKTAVDIVNEYYSWLKKQDKQKQNPCETCDHPMLNCQNFPCDEKQGELPEGCVRKQGAEAKEALYSAPCTDTINGQGITIPISQFEVTKISVQDELAEFKEEFMAIIDSWCGGNGNVYAQKVKEGVRNDVNKLLALARKQILSELPKWRKGNPSATTLYIKYGDYYMEIKELDKIFKMLIKEE